MAYFRSDNKTPGIYGYGSNTFGFAGNNITTRGADVLESLPSQKPSKNMAEASLKALRLYRRWCRMIPAILRFHEMTWIVNSTQAKLNLAKVFAEKSHLRDPAQVDFWVTKGYERLVEAELHHTYTTYLYQFLCPDVLANERGYSYLDQVKYKGKTSFLKSFYQNPNKTFF